MTVLENFAQLAASQSTNYEERLALHIKLLEAHIRSQDERIEWHKEQLNQIYKDAK
jgi:chaperonin cofactor prefoldin